MRCLAAGNDILDRSPSANRRALRKWVCPLKFLNALGSPGGSVSRVEFMKAATWSCTKIIKLWSIGIMQFWLNATAELAEKCGSVYNWQPITVGIEIAQRLRLIIRHSPSFEHISGSCLCTT
jgi:hypothetical protein